MATTRALIVDDNRLNREMLSGQLQALGYETVTACDGVEAWEHLERDGEAFDVVLLDRRMPRMDGMEVLARLKASPDLHALPVIMQTAADSDRDIIEGIQAGVFYYLTKPFKPDVLLSVTASAVADRARYRRLQEGVERQASALRLMDAGRFTFRTLREAADLSTALAGMFPDPTRQVIGLSELMTNAVEHGNLGISYDEKSALLAAGTFDAEVAARQARPGLCDRIVQVQVERLADRVSVTITDEGAGFDWQRYLEMDPKRVFDAHGRGIALARTISFDTLEYRGRGNEVVVSALTDRAPARTEGAAQGADGPARTAAAATLVAGETSGRMDGQARLAMVQDRLIHTHADLMAYRARLDDDLGAARRMQQDLLPSPEMMASLAHSHGLVLDSHFETSSELGGDLFGVQAIDDRKLALWMVDFSGHGVAAALNTFRLHALLSEFPEWMRHPGEYLSLLGARLAALLPTGQYATAFYGVVDTRASVLRYAAAATPPPLFAEVGSGRVTAGDGAGLPLGITDSAVYETREVALSPGTVLFLYSDALVECGREQGADLGRQGVVDLLARAVRTHGAAVTVADILRPALQSLSRPLSDDLTALMCRRGASPVATDRQEDTA